MDSSQIFIFSFMAFIFASRNPLSLTKYVDQEKLDKDSRILTVTAASKNRHNRIKRQIFPGTKWCGRGNIAAHYNDLGRARATDRCCRTHDYCRVFIRPGQFKYGLRNNGPTTILSLSHNVPQTPWPEPPGEHRVCKAILCGPCIMDEVDHLVCPWE